VLPGGGCQRRARSLSLSLSLSLSFSLSLSLSLSLSIFLSIFLCMLCSDYSVCLLIGRRRRQAKAAGEGGRRRLKAEAGEGGIMREGLNSCAREEVESRGR